MVGDVVDVVCVGGSNWWLAIVAAMGIVGGKLKTFF